MLIGVVFEILISALSVIGIFAAVCEIDRLRFCRRRYYIALPAEKFKGEDDFGIFAAMGLADISTGAEREVVLLFDREPTTDELRKIPELSGAKTYIKYK